MRGFAAIALLLPALVLAQAAAPAPAPEAKPLDVKVRANPDKVLIGEPFTYELTITHAKNERWELVPPTDLGAFEFVDQERDRKDGKDASVTTFKLKLQLFELGQKEIPPVQFSVSTDKGVQRYTAKGGVLVEGVSSLPKDAEDKGEALYGLKPNADVPIPSYRLVWVLLATIAGLALAYAIYKYLKRPRPVVVPPAPPPKPLDVRTLAALDALKAEDLPNTGRAREFYFRLSEIVRGYLGERFNFEALECTGSELVTAARGLNAQGLSLDALSRFVQDSDLAKYAKAEPTVDACNASLQYAYRLVHDTWSPPAPTPAAKTPDAPRPPVS